MNDCHRIAEPIPRLDAMPQQISSPNEDSLGRKLSGRVLIVGGSTRAAAWSALRAGMQPVCADLFADWDTQQIAEVIPVRNFPNSLPEDVAHVQADGWFYTGALENRPDLLERLSRPNAPYGSLWGTPAEALRLVRDPFWVATMLKSAGFATLEVLPPSTPPKSDGTWMQKPIASAGGHAIRVWNLAASTQPFHEPYYFQRRAAGRSCSALFRATADGAMWLGAAQAIEDRVITHAPHPFCYSGSQAMALLDDASQIQLQQISDLLVRSAGLRGLFGIDFQLDKSDVWPVEINPRYTASVELLELTQRRPLLANRHWGRSTDAGTDDRSQPFVSKLVLYAHQKIIAPDFGESFGHATQWETPVIADIPQRGSIIEEGWPICSVLAEGDTPESCHQQLLRRAEMIWKTLNNVVVETGRR